MANEDAGSAEAIRRPSLALMALFAGALVATGALRMVIEGDTAFAVYDGAPTVLFVVLTVAALRQLLRSGLRLPDLGWQSNLPSLRAVVVGVVAAALVVAAGNLLDPLFVQFFGEGRNLERFDSALSLTGLIILLLFSWAFAAFGEELAFRGVLMRGLARAWGDGHTAILVALFVQALVFGLVHLYQGPAGVVGASVSGLIFGGAVLAANRSLWAGILAHGLANSFGLISLYLSAA